MQISVSHSSKQHSYHLAAALLKLGALERFYTSSYVGPAWLQNALKDHDLFARRFLHGLASPYVDYNWQYELREMWVKYRQGRGAAFVEAVYARDAKFDHDVARKIAAAKSDVFWGFQGSALETLHACNAAGKRTLLELATAHVTGAKKYLGDEARLQPEWADSCDNLVCPPAYERRLEEEPFAADFAVAASGFTRQTLLEAGMAPEKILYLPLGFDLAHVPYTPTLARRPGPLRLLYAGNVTQRKGMSYLLDAMEMLPAGEVELHIVGTVQGSGKAFEARKNLYTYSPAVSQKELFGMYAEYDALVLPTLFEGFGLVLVEALAAGLPIIATPHSIGPELIDEGQTGYLVPIRDAKAIAEAITKLRNQPDEAYLAMRHAARTKALTFSWDAYRERLAQLLPTLAQ
jgi:glycosyltransferase involved in cell wall biosynthesis